MKKLIMLAAVLGLAHTAQAESEISTKAEYRVRAAISQGADLQNDSTENAVKHRFKLATEYKASDTLAAQLTLVHNAGWGAQDVVFDNGTLISDRSNVNPNNGTNDILGGSTGLVVNEAYATWRLSDELTLKLGRGSFEGGAGTSIAANDFQDVMTAFDGVAAIYETDFARITGYLIKFADFGFDTSSSSSPNFDPEANTVGLNADLKFAPELFEFFNIGINQVRRDEYTVIAEFPDSALPPGTPVPINRNKETFLKYSLSFKANFAEMFSFRAVYGANTGEYSDIAGDKGDIKSNMLDLEAGVHLEDTMNLKFSIGYHQDSGDSDPTDDNSEHYNSYYYDIHRYAGLMDVVKWGNLTYLSAKVSMEPLENFTIGAQYHIFTATEKEGYTDISSFSSGNGGFRGINSSLNGISTATGGAVQAGAVNAIDDDIGSEIDLYATHKYDNGLSLTARYGLFMVGDRVKNATTANPLFEAQDHQTFFLQGTMSF